VRSGSKVLDVAAGNGNSSLAAARRWADVTSTDYAPDLLAHGRRRAEAERLAIRFQEADAEAMPFPDGAFDVVHSNAVIEHVGGRERQEAFVREAVRVGRRVFVTTPNRWFPIEVHTRLPLVHWLPEGPAGRAYDLAGKSWARENRLLGPSDLRVLFPGPVEIRNLGLTLVAIA